MASVDPAYGQWLKADALYLRARPAGAGIWGDRGASLKAMSPFALRDDAAAEADRQALFLAGPLVRDRVLVPGQRRDLIGRAVQIIGDQLGYEQPRTVFVIGIDEGSSETVLTVIRSLA
ncbi:MAG: hypothetical protein K2X73_04810 [Sphingomonas sp.]|uniref:hypothetical protein n=1 Tax=Sphingomonas sp. TaxID=28214 RepID=UPI0025E7591F|nr:hypothetical protein [Sphingomonas sp.]MBX9881275.1 hypothetical protein [Sphingomonas sp.]